MNMDRPVAASPVTARPLALANWLFAVAGFVFVMVVVGGITRLTESGLSITRWDLVTGTLPPLSTAQWESEFALYRQTTEYIEVNGPAGMDLAQFKLIYFWEWFHRFLARMVGLAFFLPLAWFWVKKAIPEGYKPRLVALFLLGASQGALGWYMVQSGLVGRTDVSHFRLAAHLLTALFILAGLIWTALDLRQHARGNLTPATMRSFALPVSLILFVQLLLGAWVAGLNAGYITTEWPLMADKAYPAGAVDWSGGAWSTLTNDPFLIHWMHRWFAFIAAAAIIMLAIRVKPLDRRAGIALHATIGTQILLGIATVMSGMNITLAVLHQAVGALVVASLAWGAHVLGRAR
ncbi:COX15/CtaA family protein [Sphingomicrobium astaxanthinifaciens]|uniref:COX15/CtaA family protein n=1 Tax=Sphingomicrobium astaxanthinifaciens TaxID=1227949 RepID=UPI001FCB8A42|nr:COX15/CtaA family protein [Sphingomicrobium astaxanthinifaciens]MCJ7420467.1 COX15/CtaA family protein [Sphingomicrobium astaxanthinifaciens]